MAYDIALIPGDGIGPELAGAAESVMAALRGSGVDLRPRRLPAGDAALAEGGEALPRGTADAVRSADACLKAPVGESAADVIVALRRGLDLYANLRPARSQPGAPALRGDIDLLVVRENTEDLYSGHEFELQGSAAALRVVTERASARIAERAFAEAEARGRARPRVTCVHKANVLRLTDGLFARACREAAARHPSVGFDEMYVDACAMNLIRRPQSFDVIVTTNLFGDILSDESSQAAGGLGMAPAANVGDGAAIFEPVHGAAFDIAGRGEANPSSMILSAAMMLSWLSRERGDPACAAAASRVESELRGMVASGLATRDVGGSMTTSQFTDELVSRLG